MHRSTTALLLAIALTAAACSSAGTDQASPTTVPEPTTAPDTISSETSDTTAAPVALIPSATATEVSISGEPEVVYDWTTDQCEPEHIPDAAARAFRDADEVVHLVIGHYVSYRMSGPSVDEVATDCSGPVMRADFDPDPSQFNDSEWLVAPYTFDGQTIFAVMHNEYRGDTHGSARPGQCPSGQRLTCLDTSVTMAVSSDKGATFRDIRPAPGHMVATLPYTFDDQGVPSGLRQPSNIVEGPGGFFYLFTNVSNIPDEEQWVCAMRTNDLADPDSWRFWNGRGFNGEFIDPYVDPTTDPEPCAPLAFDQLTGTINETVVFHEPSGRWVMMGMTYHPVGPEPQWGVYYSTSEDLIRWSPRQKLIELPMNAAVEDASVELIYAYPSLIDPDSTSRNFETADDDAYLYLTRMNEGDGSLDRDLVRWPISIEEIDVEAPIWDFDVDNEGWLPRNDLGDFVVSDGVLSMVSEGSDPYLDLTGIDVQADFDTVVVRMRVSGEGTTDGQLFFTTSDAPATSEGNAITFVVRAGSESDVMELDMSTVAGWSGTITSLRLDPVAGTGRTIEIDHVAMGNR